MKEFITALVMLTCNVAPWGFLGFLIDRGLPWFGIIPLFALGVICTLALGVGVCTLLSLRPPSIFDDPAETPPPAIG